jgi:hypothetical protein
MLKNTMFPVTEVSSFQRTQLTVSWVLATITPEDAKKSTFGNVVFFRIPDNGQSPESRHCRVLYTIVSTLIIYVSVCLSICLSVYLTWLYNPLLDLRRFFSFLILFTAGRTPWKGDQPVARLLPAHRTPQTQNKRTQTSMPIMGFEPTIQVFERVKTFHVLERVAAVVCTSSFFFKNITKRIRIRVLSHITE